MTNPNNESQPDQEGPDEFDLLVGELRDQIEDPYITELHTAARNMQSVWAKTMNINPDDADYVAVRDDMQNTLDSKWRYMKRRIEITGLSQEIIDWNEGRFEPHMCIGEKVLSNGFLITPGDPRFYHHFWFLDEHNKPSAQGMIAIDDIQQMTLPEPSREARIKRFSYYYEDSAKFLDEIYFEAKREDQVIADLAHFSFYHAARDEDAKDALRDAIEYIRTIAEVDPIANYRMTMIGDFIAVNDNGDGVPSKLKAPHTATIKINSMVMRPADLTAKRSEMGNPQNWIPYVEATVLKTNGKNSDIVVPCTSIQSIYSTRYDGLPNG